MGSEFALNIVLDSCTFTGWGDIPSLKRVSAPRVLVTYLAWLESFAKKKIQGEPMNPAVCVASALAFDLSGRKVAARFLIGG